MGGVEILIQEGFSFTALPIPRITDDDYVGLSWDTEESLAKHLSASADSLSCLLEAVKGWALEFPRLIGSISMPSLPPLTGFGFDVFHDHTRTLAGCIRSCIPSRPHTDLIFNMEMDVDLIAKDQVPLPDHFTLKAQLGVPALSCLDREWIYACCGN